MKIPAVNFDCAYRFNTSATDLKQVGNAHATGLTQLKLWNRFDREIGRTPCAPTILIHQLRCAVPRHYGISKVSAIPSG
jgi:hypothetical protein